MQIQPQVHPFISLLDVTVLFSVSEHIVLGVFSSGSLQIGSQLQLATCPNRVLILLPICTHGCAVPGRVL